MNDYDEFKIWYTQKAPDESEVTMVDMAAMAWQAARAASPAMPYQADEIPRLVECLKKANENAEHFERQYYLLLDKVEELEARAASPKVPQGVEEWIAEHGLQYVDTLGGYGVKLKRSSELKYPCPEYVSVDDLSELLSGMAIVPVESINKALHGLEHLKADIQARSKLQEDYQEGVVMVGSGAWHGLCSAITMLAATKENGE